LTDTIINLDTVNPIEFFGVNNGKLDILRKKFPLLKILSRGTQLKISGAPEQIEAAREKIDLIVQYLQRNGHLSENYFEQILGGDDTETVDNFVEHHPNDILRPAVEAGESLGFLPGDLKEKIDPYLRPLYDALDDMIPADKLGYYMSTRTIEIAPLAYMRGRTLDNAFIILDEAQNTNDLQLKMFLTRIGANAKAIITGDPTQVDLPRNMRSGLEKSTRILKSIDGIAHIDLTEEDVVRHRLVKAIIKAYEKEKEREDKQG